MTCKSHVETDKKLWRFYSKGFLKATCKCQLVVELKAIKCYKKLFCYLSFLSYIFGLFFIIFTTLFVALFFGLHKVWKPKHTS